MKGVWLVCAAVAMGVGCDEGAKSSGSSAAARQAGNAAEGRRLVQHYGCVACHVIPGISGASGAQGPSLERLGDRPRLAAGLENTFENTVKWIMDPQGIKPGSLMPNVVTNEGEARDMAAYLREGQ
jgi:cytochrome c1